MMEAKHFLVGDKIKYQGSSVDARMARLERTIGSINGNNLWNTEGKNCYPTSTFYPVLVARNGKTVKSILQNRNGKINIEYKDGTFEYFGSNERWSHYGYSGNELMSRYKPEGWEYLYEAKEDKVEPLNLDARLAQIKKNHDFCSDFDVQVDRAKRIVADGDLKEVLRLIAKEQGYPELIEELDAPARKIKWPKGTTVRGKRTRNIYTVTEDYYEGDTRIMTNGPYGQGSGDTLERVEITVVD